MQKRYDMDSVGTPNHKYTYAELYKEIETELVADKKAGADIGSIRQKVERDKNGIKCKLKDFFGIDTNNFADKFSVLKLIKLYFMIERNYKCKINQIFSAQNELVGKHKRVVADLKSELEKGLSTEFIENTENVFCSLAVLWTENQLMFTRKYISNSMDKKLIIALIVRTQKIYLNMSSIELIAFEKILIIAKNAQVRL